MTDTIRPDREAYDEAVRVARENQRAGELQQLRFQCMELAARLPDAHSHSAVVEHGNAIFAAVTA